MNHNMTRGALAVALGLSLALAWTLGDSRAQTSVGTAFTYQGRLASGGAPVNGLCDFQFSLWNAATGGAQIGSTQTYTSVDVSAGYFTIADLDFGASAFNGEARWLAIAVRCPAGSGSYTALSPRQALTATPYAHSLRPGAVVSAALVSDSVLVVRNTASIGFSSGVFGRSDSQDGRGVFGYASATSGVNQGVTGWSASANGRGVNGLASATSGTNYGVYGRSDGASGTGVYGLASDISGTTYGVYGQSNSAAGTGVYGLASATSGTNYGVYGQSDSATGAGVYGLANATGGEAYAVYGRSRSASGRGVYGWSVAAVGLNYGVYGQSDSISGRGVYGLATATSGATYGVYGLSDSTSGRGVYGWATATSGATYGVYGRTDSTAGYGVYSFASATGGYAGYFYSPNLTGTVAVYARGNIQATGLIAGAAKAFVMDHPTDPANKYLYHFAQEGPAVQNVYNGVVTLDAAGEATVTLPDYFAAANAGPFLYQLTAIGAAMPNLHIAQKIAGNRFRIAGGIAGMEVSWEVTATRSDPTTRSLNLTAEVDKPAGEKGAYLHPAAFGQPPEKGLDYQRNTAMQRALPAGDDR